jgi:hypothetical protein
MAHKSPHLVTGAYLSYSIVFFRVLRTSVAVSALGAQHPHATTCCLVMMKTSDAIDCPSSFTPVHVSTCSNSTLLTPFD